MNRKAAIFALGWIGDTIACTAAATSLHDQGYEVFLYTRWPQLAPLLKNDKRYKTVNYFHLNILKVIEPVIKNSYELIIRSPSKWNYREPHTSEIRRIAGCDIHPAYELFLPNGISSSLSESTPRKPIFSISRDFYKRSYGRNESEFIELLSQVGSIQWVGLDAHKSSKYGKFNSLIPVAEQLIRSDFYIGPEGGMLWLAAGLGVKTIYFTEHIADFEKKLGLSDLRSVLGSKNCFPNCNLHNDIPPYCSNKEAIEIINQVVSTHLKTPV